MMDFGQAFLRWRSIYESGWGQAWWLAAEIDERYGDELGLTIYPIIHEGLGFYGIKIDQIDSTDGSQTVGRLSIGGDVENWMRAGAGLNALELAQQSTIGQPIDEILRAAIGHLHFEDIRRPPRTFRTATFTLYFRLMAVMALQVGHTEFSVYPKQTSMEGCDPGSWIWVLSANGASIELLPSGDMDSHGEKTSLMGAYRDGQRLWSLAGMLMKRLGVPQGPSSQGEATLHSYAIAEHSHRYAAWCASRAASRGLAGFSTTKAREAIEHCGLAHLISGPVRAWPTDAEDFDGLHGTWCTQVRDYLKAHGVADVGYGHAAKIVAIYLKGRVVCGGALDSVLAHIAHPPIDRILLQALAKDQQFSQAERNNWRQINWTQLTSETYRELIESLRKAHLHEAGFWRTEVYWSGA
jgi:hypothetical protein